VQLAGLAVTGGRQLVTRGCRKVAREHQPGVDGTMNEPAIYDLVRELDLPSRRRDPELEVELEVGDDALLDPWFLLSEAEIAAIEDDPSAQITEIRITGYGTGLEDDSRWAF
jgi:hypothetical protein